VEQTKNGSDAKVGCIYIARHVLCYMDGMDGWMDEIGWIVIQTKCGNTQRREDTN
jgi:hypothetical protein